MPESGPSIDKDWRYRFSRPGNVEIEIQEFAGDEAAEAHARELSKSLDTAVIVHRLHGHVDWEYLTEADERS
jgi:hypothetical protein